MAKYGKYTSKNKSAPTKAAGAYGKGNGAYKHRMNLSDGNFDPSLFVGNTGSVSPNAGSVSSATIDALTIEEQPINGYSVAHFEGGNSASVTVAGNATLSGSPVSGAKPTLEIRTADTGDVVKRVEGGATSDSSGDFSVTTDVPGNRRLLLARFIDPNGDASDAVQTSKWVCGVIVLLRNASLIAHIVDNVLGASGLYESRVNPECVVFSNLVGDAGSRTVNNDGADRNTSLRVFNDFWWRLSAPYAICVVDASQSGSSPADIYDDPDASADFATLIDYYQGNGTDFDIVTELWMNNVSENNLDAYERNYLGKNPDGSENTTENGYLWHLTQPQLAYFSTSRTKWIYSNMEQAIAANASDKALNFTDMSRNPQARVAERFTERVEESQGTGDNWDQILASPGYGLDMILLAEDGVHPGPNRTVGQARGAAYLAWVTAKGCGFIASDDIPKITNVVWASDGTSADVEISLPNGGDLSTEFAEEAAGNYSGELDASLFTTPTTSLGTFDHHLEIMGFELRSSYDGNYLPSGFTAEIVDSGSGSGSNRTGTVRITPDSAVSEGCAIRYAYGTGGGRLYGINFDDGANEGEVDADFIFCQRRPIETGAANDRPVGGYPVQRFGGYWPGVLYGGPGPSLSYARTDRDNVSGGYIETSRMDNLANFDQNVLTIELAAIVDRKKTVKILQETSVPPQLYEVGGATPIAIDYQGQGLDWYDPQIATGRVRTSLNGGNTWVVDGSFFLPTEALLRCVLSIDSGNDEIYFWVNGNLVAGTPGTGADNEVDPGGAIGTLPAGREIELFRGFAGDIAYVRHYFAAAKPANVDADGNVTGLTVDDELAAADILGGGNATWVIQDGNTFTSYDAP